MFGDNSGKPGKDDDQRRWNRSKAGQDKCGQEDNGSQFIDDPLLCHGKDCIQHQGADHDTYSCQRMEYDRHMDEILQDGGNQTDDNK